MKGRWTGSPDVGPLAFEPDPPPPIGGPRAAAFLDRDGTLNAGVPDPASDGLESPLSVADVRLLPGAAEAARSLSAAGYALVCISNQPAAAKQKVSLAELKAVHERVLTLLEQDGVEIAGSRICLHHPDASDPALRGACSCRKPGDGMLRHAADALGLVLEDSWMLGDTDSDVEAGSRAGCRTVLLEYSGTGHKRSASPEATIVARDLPEGVERLLRRARA
jgi:D-glycero-D-manno-heptose 1,7-bisphosphate phosphatase